MTTDTDKLVEMAQAAGIGTVGGVPTAHPAAYTKLAAFRAAIIADLCGDVEPVAWVYWHPSDTTYDGPDTLHKKAVSRFTDDTRKAMMAKGWLFEPLYPASTAAQPLKAEQAKDAAEDAELLDWLDTTNKRFKMGWKVGVAPAGNCSVQSVIFLGNSEPVTIRAAIRAARAAERKA